MGATTQKNTFDEVYKVFGTDYQGKQMMDWANYAKNIDGKNYYVWAELEPFYTSDRIPFWNWNKGFLDKAPYDGYLPGGVNEFYFKMRPISWRDINGSFTAGLRNNVSTVGTLKTLNFYNRQDSHFRTAATVHFFDTRTGKYKTVLVPILESLFKIRYHVFSADTAEGIRENFLLWNKHLREYAKALQDQYNYALTISQHSRFGYFKDSYQREILALQNDAATKVNALLNDPNIYGKKCAECGKSAIGAIPLLWIVVGLSLTAFTVVAWKVVDAIKNLQTQKVQAQRATDALKQYQAVLADTNLSQADKDKFFKLTGSVVDNANNATNNATANTPGFFDRVENLLFLVGGFLILNNVTKKS